MPLFVQRRVDSDTECPVHGHRDQVRCGGLRVYDPRKMHLRPSSEAGSVVDSSLVPVWSATPLMDHDWVAGDESANSDLGRILGYASPVQSGSVESLGLEACRFQEDPVGSGHAHLSL